jgi:hypothetical protein
MRMSQARRYRAGDSVEDLCRACKTDRMHTVMVVDAAGIPIRVVCDYCRSEHNYRQRGEALAKARGDSERRTPPTARESVERESFALVSDRERTAPPMSVDRDLDVELLLRRIIREETGLTAVTPADKWRGGHLVLRPGAAGLQEKSWPIETFFHKVVMLRNRLRTLEQHVNASELPDDVKVKLQGYITGCYGSLTSFNVLFADEADQFKGSGGE